MISPVTLSTDDKDRQHAVDLRPVSPASRLVCRSENHASTPMRKGRDGPRSPPVNGSTSLPTVCGLFTPSFSYPGVRLMERYRLPRWLASLLMVLLMLTIAYLVIYVIYDRDARPSLCDAQARREAETNHRAHSVDGPQHPAKHADHHASFPGVEPAYRAAKQESPYEQFLLRGIGSVYAFTITVMFIPFWFFSCSPRRTNCGWRR